MSEQISVVLIDQGDNIGAMNEPGAPPGAMPSRTVPAGGTSRLGTESGSRTTADDGEKHKKKNDPTVTDASFTLAGAISKALGGVFLIDNAIKLRDSFIAVTKAVYGLDDAINKVDGSPGTTLGPSTTVSSEPVSSATKAADDFIEGEFEFAGASRKSSPADEVISTALTTRTVLPAIPKGGAVAAGGEAAAAGVAASSGGAGLAGQIAGAAKALGPFGIAAGVATVAIGGTVYAVKTFTDAMHNEAKRLEGVSAELSVAGSMNDVRAELADIRRADLVGPQLARFENARGRLGDASAKVMDQIYAALAKIGDEAVPAILSTAAGVEVVAAWAAEMVAKLDVVSARAGDLQAMGDALGRQAEAAVKRDAAMERFFRGQVEKKALPD